MAQKKIDEQFAARCVKDYEEYRYSDIPSVAVSHELMQTGSTLTFVVLTNDEGDDVMMSVREARHLVEMLNTQIELAASLCESEDNGEAVRLDEMMVAINKDKDGEE